MVTKGGSRFDIHEDGNLYYLPTVEKDVDQCKAEVFNRGSTEVLQGIRQIISSEAFFSLFQKIKNVQKTT